MKPYIRFLLAIVCLAGIAATWLDGASVRGRFSVADEKGTSISGDSGAVVWLTPMHPGLRSNDVNASAPRLTLTQKSKRFDPHILVVPLGTVVDFPNRDPFFHNVFSLFDGKRFDLGLYEAGSTRGVRFDRPGICYIFCNIHPEMSAVIVVVNSPYFAISNKAGEFDIPGVPAGRYQFNVWAEHSLPQVLKDLSREVTVGGENAVLGTIHLQTSRNPVVSHPNKYGGDYDPQVFSSPRYGKP